MKISPLLLIALGAFGCHARHVADPGTAAVAENRVVRVLYAPGWGMGALAVAMIREVAESKGLVVEIRSEKVAADLSPPPEFMGSPTILVNGLDMDPAARGQQGSAFGWRIYPDARPESPGVPSESMIEQAFIEAGWIEWDRAAVHPGTRADLDHERQHGG